MLHNVTFFFTLRKKSCMFHRTKSPWTKRLQRYFRYEEANKVSAENRNSPGVGSIRDRGATEEETIRMGLFGGNKAQCAVLSTPKVLVHILFLNYGRCS